MSDFKHNSEVNYIEIIQRLVKCIVALLVIIVVLLIFLIRASSAQPKVNKSGVTLETSAKQPAKKVQDLSDTVRINSEKELPAKNANS